MIHASTYSIWKRKLSKNWGSDLQPCPEARYQSIRPTLNTTSVLISKSKTSVRVSRSGPALHNLHRLLHVFSLQGNASPIGASVIYLCAPLEIEGSSLYLKSTSCFRLGDGWMWHRIYWRKTSHIALQLKNDLGFPNNQRRWNLHVTYFLQFLQLWIDFYLQG